MWGSGRWPAAVCGVTGGAAGPVACTGLGRSPGLAGVRQWPRAWGSTSVTCPGLGAPLPTMGLWCPLAAVGQQEWEGELFREHRLGPGGGLSQQPAAGSHTAGKFLWLGGAFFPTVAGRMGRFQLLATGAPSWTRGRGRWRPQQAGPGAWRPLPIASTFTALSSCYLQASPCHKQPLRPSCPQVWLPVQ